MLFVLYRKRSYFSGKTIAANAGDCGFEFHRDQHLVFTCYSIRLECQDFCVIQINTLKINIVIRLSKMTTFNLNYCTVSSTQSQDVSYAASLQNPAVASSHEEATVATSQSTTAVTSSQQSSTSVSVQNSSVADSNITHFSSSSQNRSSQGSHNGHQGQGGLGIVGI